MSPYPDHEKLYYCGGDSINIHDSPIKQRSSLSKPVSISYTPTSLEQSLQAFILNDSTHYQELKHFKSAARSYTTAETQAETPVLSGKHPISSASLML